MPVFFSKFAPILVQILSTSPQNHHKINTSFLATSETEAEQVEILKQDLVYFTTRAPDASDISATRVQHERYEYDKNNAIATRVKNFDCENNTCKNKFLNP